MKNSKENYTAALIAAKELPTHVGGELQDHYKFFGTEKYFRKVMYSENLTPVNVFECLNPKYTGATRFYVQTSPSYREDGNLKKMKNWNKKLMFHKAWARTDIEIENVNLDIIGIKRETTHLPGGVLIANIEFIKKIQE